jgi:hypothetical protein
MHNSRPKAAEGTAGVWIASLDAGSVGQGFDLQLAAGLLGPTVYPAIVPG